MIFTESFESMVAKFGSVVAAQLTDATVVKDFIFLDEGNDFISSMALLAQEYDPCKSGELIHDNKCKATARSGLNWDRTCHTPLKRKHEV